MSDLRNILSHLTLKRLGNIIGVTTGYLMAKWFGRSFHFGLPIALSIEPTTSCNLRCPECPSGLRSFTRPTGMLRPELFHKVIDELHENLFYLIFYFQGEPYLHPSFTDLVAYAVRKNIYTATSTNGHYLNDSNAEKTVRSGLNRLIISIDGTTQQTYENYRIGGSLDKVLEGTRNIIQWKRKLRSSTPYVIFQFLVVRPNEHQVAEVKELAKNLGVDEVVFKTAQIYDYEKGNDLIPLNERYSRYVQSGDGKWRIKNPLLNHCWKLWHSCVITWDGDVVPCCFDKDSQYRMGNVASNTFKSIWKNENYKIFRSKVLKSRSEVDICRNCTEGTKIWA